MQIKYYIIYFEKMRALKKFERMGETSAGYTSLNLMAVPEPSAAFLMGIGLGALVIVRTFRRRQS